MLFYGVRVDSIIDFCQFPVQVPSKGQATVFVRFQALVVFDNIQLEFGRNPRSELKGYVLVSKCDGISALFGHNSLRTGLFHPSFRGKDKTVQTGFTLNCLEFEVIELRIVKMLPKT